MRNFSKIAPGWWDYTTLNEEILNDAFCIKFKDIKQFSRPGFSITIYDSLEKFYVSEALEYIECWKKSSLDNPTGICGPIGPVEHLPLVPKIVNELEINIRNGHFWAMDEWYVGEKEQLKEEFSFTKTNLNLWFLRIKEHLRMPLEHLHFPEKNSINIYSNSFNDAKCLIMQGGQGDVKHWAFNDPVKRSGKYKEEPPTPAEYRKKMTRIVELHPSTISQNARTSGGGNVCLIPSKAITVGPVETWKSEKVSIWHNGIHDNSFGIKLTTLMISKRIIDSSVPISLLADHPNVQFNFYKGALMDDIIQLH